MKHELTDLLVPVLQQLVTTGHLRRRARVYLEKFYYSEKALDILITKALEAPWLLLLIRKNILKKRNKLDLAHYKFG